MAQAARLASLLSSHLCLSSVALLQSKECQADALSALSWVGTGATLLHITGHVECHILGREVPMGSAATGAKAASSTGHILGVQRQEEPQKST